MQQATPRVAEVSSRLIDRKLPRRSGVTVFAGYDSVAEFARVAPRLARNQPRVAATFEKTDRRSAADKGTARRALARGGRRREGAIVPPRTLRPRNYAERGARE